MAPPIQRLNRSHTMVNPPSSNHALDMEYLHTRLGVAHAEARFSKEQAHRQRVLRWHNKVFHLENWYSVHQWIRGSLLATGLLRRGVKNARRISLRHNPVYFHDLPTSFDGYRILHLSDLHLDMDEAATHNIIAAVREVNYDLCVMTGDYRAKTFGDSTRTIELLQSLRSHLRSPVYAVLGNHDSIALLEAMERMDYRVLMNEGVVITQGDESIGLAGVDDAHYFQLDDAAKAIAPIRDQALKILLSHTPENYQSAAQAGADFFLCGHTHGGQICLPGGIPVILEARCPRHLGKGRWKHNDMQGYTSSGASTSIVNVRLNCPAEITLHTLFRDRRDKG